MFIKFWNVNMYLTAFCCQSVRPFQRLTGRLQLADVVHKLTPIFRRLPTEAQTSGDVAWLLFSNLLGAVNAGLGHS
jgi:hypothetical protein